MYFQLWHNLFNGFSIAGIVIGSFLLFSKIHVVNFRLGLYHKAWLIAILVHLTFWLLNLNEVLPETHPFYWIGFPLCMLHLPLFYFNIVELTRNRPLRKWEAGLHLLPYVLYVLVLFGLGFQGLKPIVKDGLIEFPAGTPSVIYNNAGMLLAYSGILYSILGLIELYRYMQRIPNEYSFKEQVDLKWIQYLVWATVVLFVIIYGIISLLLDFGLSDQVYVFRWVGIYVSLFVIYMGFRFQQQLNAFAQIPMQPVEVDSKAYQNSGISKDEIQGLALEIDKYLQQEKAFLDENLNLNQLSEALEVSNQQLSQAINQGLETNFYELINAYRLEEAKAKLTNSEYDHYSILGIALASGFKSKSTFYKLFKQEVGITPTQYRKNTSK